MDIRKIKENAVNLRNILKKNNIRADLFILFGSYASGEADENSDIDIAVISKDFGHDRFKEGSILNYYASSVDHRFEAIPVSLKDYLSNESVSPILHEITTKGIPLL